jgi:hypothetical protein
VHRQHDHLHDFEESHRGSRRACRGDNLTWRKMQNASLFLQSKMFAIKWSPLSLWSLVTDNLASIPKGNQQYEFLKGAYRWLVEHQRRQARKGLTLAQLQSGRRRRRSSGRSVTGAPRAPLAH